MWGPTSGGDDRVMIIDPHTFIALEMDRHLAAAEAARAARRASSSRHREHVRHRPRGLVVRLAIRATGRAVHA
jgi:hypothetical protein